MATDKGMNRAAGIAAVGVAAMLVVLKLWALGDTRALSVAASLADSALDLMMALGGLLAILYAARPADEDHAYGHSSAEDLAALGQSIFIALSAGGVAWAAAARLLSPSPPALEHEARGIVVMAVSIALALALMIGTRIVAGRTGNRVVAAQSLNQLGDLAPNLGAVLSLWISAAFDVVWVDSVVAIAAACLLLFGAARIFRGAWDALMDRGADPEVIAGIEALISDFEGVEGFHDLKTRMAGSVTFVTLHIELDGRLSLDEAHAIGAALRRAILVAFPGTDVMIHKDPVGVEPHPDDPSRG